MTDERTDLGRQRGIAPLQERQGGTNLLLDVGPDKHGLIPGKYIIAVQRLRANIDKPGM